MSFALPLAGRTPHQPGRPSLGVAAGLAPCRSRTNESARTMSTYREQSEKAKALRREPAPDILARVPSKTRKAKPKDTHGVYRIWLKDDPTRVLKSLFKPGEPYRTFPSEQAAQMWVDKHVRTMSHVPEKSGRSLQQQMARERQRWEIKELQCSTATK
jgi:hypothetical protein